MSRRHWSCRIALASLALAGLVACGGDDDGGDGDGDGGGDGNADCPIAGSLGSVEPEAGATALHFTQPAMVADPSVRYLSVVAVVNEDSDAVADLLVIQLWDGFGAFREGQVAAGEFELTGEETADLTCGACAFLFGNAAFVNGEPDIEKRYIATSGTMVIDDVGQREANEITGSFTGSLNDVTFVEIDEDSATGTPLEGGCETTLEAVGWSAVISNGD